MTTSTSSSSSSIHFSNIPKKRSVPWSPAETELLQEKTSGRSISAKEARELQPLFPNRTPGAIEHKVNHAFRKSQKERKYGDTVQLSDYMDNYSDEDWNESLEYNDYEKKQEDQQQQQTSVYYPTIPIVSSSYPLLSLSLPSSPGHVLPLATPLLSLQQSVSQEQQQQTTEEEDEVLKAYKEFKQKGKDRESKLKEIEAKRIQVEPEFLKLQETMKELEATTQKLKQETEDDNLKMNKVKELLF